MSDKDLMILLVLALIVKGQSYTAVSDARTIFNMLKEELDTL